MNLTKRLLTREGFFVAVLATLSGIVGIVLGIPITIYMLAPVIHESKDVWRDVKDAETGQTIDANTIPAGITRKVIFYNKSYLPWSGETEYTASWLRHEEGNNYIAYAVNCTHLGCPVKWLQEAKIFLCPCHGSVFNADGTVAGGPAPRPLFTYPVRVYQGRVQIKAQALPVV